MNAFFAICMAIAVLLTVGTLFVGLFSMARGGEFNKKNANKLMRMRIYAQGAALLFFALAMMAHG